MTDSASGSTGQTFFVTGGSRGIGRNIVHMVSKAGHDVAFTYHRDVGAAEKTLAEVRELAPSRQCKAYQLDVKDPAGVERVIEQALADFGKIDAAVCNAGI